jgi:hypothetical protein
MASAARASTPHVAGLSVLTFRVPSLPLARRDTPVASPGSAYSTEASLVPPLAAA